MEYATIAGQTICCAICPCCPPCRILRNTLKDPAEYPAGSCGILCRILRNTLQDPVSADADPGSEKTEILSMDVSCLCRLVIYTDNDFHPNLGSSNLNSQRFK